MSQIAFSIPITIRQEVDIKRPKSLILKRVRFLENIFSDPRANINHVCVDKLFLGTKNSICNFCSSTFSNFNDNAKTVKKCQNCCQKNSTNDAGKLTEGFLDDHMSNIHMH